MEIQAAVCRDFGAPLALEALRLAAPGPREVVVTIEAVAICHSDITYASGDWGGDLPAVFGHEACGRVRSVGAAVQGIAPGDRVLVTLMRACGVCASCATGKPAHCSSKPDGGPLRDASGAPVLPALDCGAFAEHVVVDMSQLAPLPEDIPSDAACLLACGVITGVGAAVNTARIRPGEAVVVIGAGGVGLNAVQGARLAGARRVVAVDRTPERLETAREFGATDGVVADSDAPWRAARAMLGGGADVVLLCTGAMPAFDGVLKYLGRCGRLVLVGMPPSGALVSYEPVELASKGQHIIGSKMGDTVLARDIPWMIDLYRQGRLKLDELVSARWPLDRINEAIADTRSGAARRNVILF